jgi:hypothetical protein
MHSWVGKACSVCVRLPLYGRALDLAQKAVKSDLMLLLALATDKRGCLSIIAAHNTVYVFYGLAAAALEFPWCQPMQDCGSRYYIFTGAVYILTG